VLVVHEDEPPEIELLTLDPTARDDVSHADARRSPADQMMLPPPQPGSMVVSQYTEGGPWMPATERDVFRSGEH
jgi:hypothetical protein